MYCSSPFRSQFFAYAWSFYKLLVPLKFSQKLEFKEKHDTFYFGKN